MFLKSDSIGGGEDNQVYAIGLLNSVYDSSVVGGEANAIYVYYGTDNVVDSNIVGGTDSGIGVDGSMVTPATGNEVIGNVAFGGSNEVSTNGNTNYVDYNAVNGGRDNYVGAFNSANANVRYSKSPDNHLFDPF